MNKSRTGKVLNVMCKRETVMRMVFDGLRDRRTLKDELDQSRSTVYRALEELAEVGLVTESSGVYEPTLYGRLVFGEYDQFTGRIDTYDDAAGMIGSIEAVDEIPESVLVESELIPARRPDPMAAVQPIHDTFREEDDVRGFSPVVRPRCLELLTEQFETGSLRADIVLGRDVLSHLGRRRRRQLQPFLDTGELSVRLSRRTLPFGMVLGAHPEPDAYFTIYDTSGRFEGVLRSESAEVVEWATGTFEEWREQSSRLTTLEPGNLQVDDSANS